MSIELSMNALKKTAFNFPGQTGVYYGKVRDVYHVRDQYLVMVASDRISAFDVILPEPIPCKGQVLNQLAAKFLEGTRDIVPNWVAGVPDPNVTIGIKCEPYPVEMVIRGYLAGHAWREYRAGKRMICGVPLPEGLRENDQLPYPIITPTTKASQGHDEDIPPEEIVAQSLVSKEDYARLEEYTYMLYQRGVEMAAKRGLILVDTKYEFGRSGGRIYLMDEVHTPDSSRYFYLNGYEQRQQRGEPQKQLSKEFVRQWLIGKGFQGQEGQPLPAMTPDVIQSVSERYIELYEHLAGEKFTGPEPGIDITARIERNVLTFLNNELF